MVLQHIRIHQPVLVASYQMGGSGMGPATDLRKTEVQRVAFAPQELGDEGYGGDYGGEGSSVDDNTALLCVRNREQQTVTCASITMAICDH